MDILIVGRTPDGRVAARVGNLVVQANWKGERWPVPGETVDAEIGIKGALRWGREIELARPDAVEGFGADGSLIGTVERIDDDGVLYLRACGGISLIAAEAPASSIHPGSVIRVKGAEVDLYPTGV